MLASHINTLWAFTPSTLLSIGAMCGAGVLSVLMDISTHPPLLPGPVVLAPTKTTPTTPTLVTNPSSLTSAIALCAVCAVIATVSSIVVLSKCRSPAVPPRNGFGDQGRSPVPERWDDEEEEEQEGEEEEGWEEGSDDQDQEDSQEEGEATEDQDLEDTEDKDKDMADEEADVTEGGAPPPPPNPPAAVNQSPRFPRKWNAVLLTWLFYLIALLSILAKYKGAFEPLVRHIRGGALRTFERVFRRYQYAHQQSCCTLRPPLPAPSVPSPSPRLPLPLLKAWREERGYVQETLASLPRIPAVQPQQLLSSPLARPPPSSHSVFDALYDFARRNVAPQLQNGWFIDALATCILALAIGLSTVWPFGSSTNVRTQRNAHVQAVVKKVQDPTASSSEDVPAPVLAQARSPEEATSLILAPSLDPRSQSQNLIIVVDTAGQVSVLALQDNAVRLVAGGDQHLPDALADVDVAIQSYHEGVGADVLFGPSSSSVVDGERSFPGAEQSPVSFDALELASTSTTAPDPSEDTLDLSMSTKSVVADWTEYQALPFSMLFSHEQEHPKPSEGALTHQPLLDDPVDIELAIVRWSNDSCLAFSPYPSGAWDESPGVLEEVVTHPCTSSDATAQHDQSSSLANDEPSIPDADDISFNTLELPHCSYVSVLAAGPVEDTVTSALMTTSIVVDYLNDLVLPFPTPLPDEDEELLGRPDNSGCRSAVDDLVVIDTDTLEWTDDHVLPFVDGWEQLSQLPKEVVDCPHTINAPTVPQLDVDDLILGFLMFWEQIGEASCKGEVRNRTQDESVAVLDVDHDSSEQDTSPASTSHSQDLLPGDDAESATFREEERDLMRIEDPLPFFDFSWQVLESVEKPVAGIVVKDPGESVALLLDLEDGASIPVSPTEKVSVINLPESEEHVYPHPPSACAEEIAVADKILLASSSLEEPKDCRDLVSHPVAESMQGASTQCEMVRMSVAHFWQPREQVLDVSTDSLDDVLMLVHEKGDQVEGDLFTECFFAGPMVEDFDDDHIMALEVAAKKTSIENANTLCASTSRGPEPCERGFSANRTSYAFLWQLPQQAAPAAPVDRDSLADASMEVLGRNESVEGDLFTQFFTGSVVGDFDDGYAASSKVTEKATSSKNVPNSSGAMEAVLDSVKVRPDVLAGMVVPSYSASPSAPGRSPTSPTPSTPRLASYPTSLPHCSLTVATESSGFNPPRPRPKPRSFIPRRSVSNRLPKNPVVRTPRQADTESKMQSSMSDWSLNLDMLVPDQTNILEVCAEIDLDIEDRSVDISEILSLAAIGETIGDVTFSLMPDQDKTADWEFLEEMQKEWEWFNLRPVQSEDRRSQASLYRIGTLALGAIPDVITTDANNVLDATGNLAVAIRPLPVSGPVDRSLVLHFDQNSLGLKLGLQTAFSDISTVDPTPLAPADAAQLFSLVAPLRNETVGMLAELQTKIAFRDSFSSVAVPDLSAQSKGFSDYLTALGRLTPGPVSDQMSSLKFDILVAYDDALRFLNARV